MSRVPKISHRLSTLLVVMATLGSAISLPLLIFGGVGGLFGFLEQQTGLPIDDLPYAWLLKIGATALLVLVAAVLARQLNLFSELAESRAERRAADLAKARALVRSRYLEHMREEISERRKASIHYEVIKLQQHERFGAANPWHFVAEREPNAARSFTDISDCFEHFKRRLLLLGDPGSGKTTSLLFLAEKLIADASVEPDQPIPLFLSLSQFQDFPSSEDRRSNFPAGVMPVREAEDDRWIQNRIAELVGKLSVEGLSARIVCEWIDSGDVVLLLDGLDEVEESRRAALVDYLNQNLFQQRSNTPTLVTSRIVEYRIIEQEPDKRLRLEGAVTLQPLSDQQIDDYLEQASALGLIEVLPSDGALKDLARAPLTLSMMTLAYSGLDADEIRSSSSALDRRREVFDRYVDRMMQREAWRRRGEPWDPRRPVSLKTPYTREAVDHYLGWLASALSRRALTRFDSNRLRTFLIQKPVVGAWSWHDPLLLGSIATLVLSTALRKNSEIT